MPPFWPGVDPWSPLAGGLLGGVLKKMASGRRARPAFARLIEQYRPQLEAYEGLCEDLGETPPMWPWRGSCRILSLPLH
jgi:aryl-alcohol dehydrogenase-like predicted oxidoreductase